MQAQKLIQDSKAAFLKNKDSFMRIVDRIKGSEQPQEVLLYRSQSTDSWLSSHNIIPNGHPK